MDKFFSGALIGILVALFVLVLSFDLTPQVTYKQVQKAEYVCKNGYWKSIDKESIYCEDGAVYKLQEVVINE